jgi:hypothetical protein
MSQSPFLILLQHACFKPGTGQRSIWESDWEVVKRSGRDESIWVVIHLYMEAMLGISMHSYPYLN